MGLRDLLRKELPMLRFAFVSPWNVGSRWFRQRAQYELRAVLSQLEAIVRVNAPLPEGLSQCAFDAPSARIAYILRTLSERVSSGMSLADAMESMGSRFPAHVVAEVRAGESVGSLARALRTITAGVNERLVSGRELRNHTAYIASLLVIEFGILSFLVLKVFPVFAEILEEFGMKSDALSVRVMESFSNVVRHHSIQIAAAVVAAPFVALAIRLLYVYIRPMQVLYASALIVLPVVRRVYRDKQLHSIARAMELRLRGGTPLPQALRDTAIGDFPYPYQRMLERCAREVERGSTLSTALAYHRLTAGRALPEIIRLGEAREDLAAAFAEAARLTGQSVRRNDHLWAQALVPIGVGVGAIGVVLATVASFTMFAAMGDAIIRDL